MKPTTVSFKTIVLFFTVPLVGYICWANKDVIFSFFIAFILMSALRPAVDYLHNTRKLARATAALLVYVGFLAALSVLLGTIVPPIVNETLSFIEKLPDLVSDLPPQLVKYVRLQEVSQQVAQYIPSFTNQLFSLVAQILSNTVLVITTLALGFYLLVEDDFDNKIISGYLSKHTRSKLSELMQLVQTGLNSWFWGELTLMLVVGVLSYIGFAVIGLKYAVPLAVLAGLLEAVPTYGPTAALVPAVLLGFGVSPLVGLAALAWGFVVQQLENNLLVPYIMKKAVGISPVTTLLALFAGLRLAGPLGILLAIPLHQEDQLLFLR
jgi:predicted PurR-regulated permease PerM